MPSPLKKKKIHMARELEDPAPCITPVNINESGGQRISAAVVYTDPERWSASTDVPSLVV